MGKGKKSRYIKYAKVAGALYLVIIAAGLFSEFFVRSKIILQDSAATIENITLFQSLYRAGFVSDTLMVTADIIIAILFYIIFRKVNKYLSLTAAVFRLTQALLICVSLLFYFAPLILLDSINPETHETITPGLFIELHAYGYDFGLIFFGVSNLILGYLIVKSKIIPQIFGYGLSAAAVVYILGSFIRFLFPDIFFLIQPLYLIPLIAELSVGIWLLLKGVDLNKLFS